MVLQSLALAAIPFGDQSLGQYVSIAWSILNIAYNVVGVTFAVDTSAKFRVIDPRHYGFIEASKENAISAALGLFSTGYLCSKLFAVAILGTAHGVALLTCFSSECL